MTIFKGESEFEEACDVCGNPAAATWKGVNDINICRWCSITVLPALIADAMRACGTNSNILLSTKQHLDGRFWRAAALALSRPDDHKAMEPGFPGDYDFEALFGSYENYLSSEEWMNKSEAAKARAGHRCQVCNAGAGQATLHAHHRTYERIGREDNADLIVLCSACHTLFHENRKLVR